MGKIKKSPTERHTATASPVITQYVESAASVPLHKLPAKLDAFPRHWPFPRGDLYHWIPLLDRFDHIFEIFNREYGLNVGLQLQPFARRILERGDAEEGKPQPNGGADQKELDAAGYGVEGDRELVQSILRFTRVLLERCGNRSLYASSGQINDLLHTTSLDLLQACLKLSLRLAQRYQVARFKNNNPPAQGSLLFNHYNINLDNVHKLSLPLPRPRITASSTNTSKSKEKSGGQTYNPADLVAMARNTYSAPARKELSTLVVTYPAPPAAKKEDGPADTAPNSPTPHRQITTPHSAASRPAPPERSRTASDLAETPSKARDSYFPAPSTSTYELSASEIAETDIHQILKDALQHVPKDSQYELLQRARIAKVFASSESQIKQLLEIRLLAIANLAYALDNAKFQETIGNADAEEPRRFHLAHQLCDLLQPSSDGQSLISLTAETTVIDTLEALARCRHKSSEVIDALAVTVNHGVLYYELRRAIASLQSNTEPQDLEELIRIDWRIAIFDLITTISQVHNHIRCAEKMVSAGIMEILTEALKLRTNSAERVHDKILGFISSFTHGIQSAFPALANAHGLEAITDLASDQVTAALKYYHEADPASHDELKSKVVDYSITYYQQSTLRSILKFITYLFDHTSGVHDRLTRNLLDSPQTLKSLREIIGNAPIFGSNVWDAAINTVSNFIHHEPTSFQVIAEAGLARGILEAVTQKPLEDEQQQSEAANRDEIVSVDGKVQLPTVKGILPVSETICDIPTAFGAICLNEDGMNLFQTSGALDAYFDIFLSPNHVKALEEESQTAFSIGNQFDELSRHHPGLQGQILDAVIRMLKRVRSLCNLMAPQSSVTLRPSSSATSEDTAMSNSTSESQEEIFNRAPAIPYISACFKFLEGFFHNSTMCQKFCRTGNADVVLDLIISPANPYDLSVFPVIGKMATVVHRLCEEKPHLVLPSLLARAVSNVEQLETFAESQGPDSYFDAYTTIDHTSESTPDGVKLARSLANTCALSIVLGRIFTTPGFSGRNASTNQLFNNLNFTDVYVSLIARLGKLHSACIWEDLALHQRVPDLWKPFVKPEVLHVRNVDSNGLVHITHNCAHCKFEGMEGKDELIADISGPANLKKLFAFKNSRLLLFLLKQVSSGVEQFFQSLGVVLLPKRTIDNYHKENASLVAEQLAQSLVDSFTYRKFNNSTELDLARYHDSILNTTNKMLLRTTSNIESFGAKEAITIVLSKFYSAGGLDRMNDLIEQEIAGKDTAETSLKEARSDNFNLILSFFAQITRSKCILDAAQSLPITVRGYEYVDHFVPAQFLVEIRLKVLSSVSKLWKSDAMGNLSANNAKPVIEILQNILTGDGEERAIKRSDNAMKKIATERPTFKLKFPSHLGDLLQGGIERSLAWESIHRCYNDQTRALEYCELRTDGSAPRFPLSETLLDKPIGRDGSVHVVEQSTSQSNQASQDHEDSDDSMSDDDNTGSLGRLPSDVVNQDLADMGGELLHPWVQSEAQPPNGGERKVPFLTVDDLNEQRTILKEDLIDRCLEVLSSTSTVTFALADLIQAAVAKTGESANPRAEIGKTLVSSLMSLQGGDNTPATTTKISAYAHLVALILQDRDFFDSTFDELQDYFSSLIDWIMPENHQTAEDLPYIETILLIIERVLAEDEQPREIQWTPPPANQPIDKTAQLAPIVAQPVVSEGLRLKLFSVLKAILPKIGKNHSLALSISRVLVILTRDPTIIAKAKDKQFLQRLFLMVRQLARPVGERLQSAIMLILRHCVEDEDSIRQSMRTGIKTAFESGRHVRGMDLNGYVRTLHQMVLREPRIFAEVTAEMVEITNFNGNVNKSHQLALKKPQTSSNDDAEASKDVNGQISDKSAETKVSSESTDGIVQFLLRELSNFKEVDDSAAASKPANENEQSSITDQSNQNGSAEPSSGESQATEAKNTRHVFKPEDNVIYIYRCFLMQCLAELLACYSRTKLEFINFSRKAEGPTSTPSKPRSGTINYLLNQLLPVGTLEHRDDSTHRKRVATSDWATTVLVALCSQTHEKPYFERRGAAESELSQEDSDLTFVRRFVLEHAIRSFKDALTSPEAPDMRYSRLMAFADLFDRMLNTKQDRSNVQTAIFARSQMQIGRLMYEKNCIAILTASIAELDLSLPNAKRVVKHILGPIKTLTDLAVTLSQQGEISSSGPGTSTDDEEISSATSVSDEASDEERENTPDLFRNSTLSMFESSGAHEEESDSPDDEDEDEDDDEEMFDAGFDEEMEYEDGNGDTISDDDEDVEGMEGMDEMGDIEGMPGDVEYDVEIINEDEEDDEDDDDEDESDEGDEDDEDVDDDDMDDEHDEYLQSMEEITGADDSVSNPEMDEGAWEENAEYGHIMPDEEGNSPPGGPLEHIAEVLGADDHEELERHGIVGIDLANGPPDFFDDDMMGGHEDDEDEEYDGEVAYEPEVEEDEETAERWGIDLDNRAHNAFFHPRGPERAITDVLNRLNDIRRPEVRLHRGGHGHHHHQQVSDEGGLHPLLQRMDPRFHGRDPDQPVGGMPIIMSEHGLMSGARSHAFQDFMMALDRNEFSRFTVTMGANGHAHSPFHGMRHFTRFMDMNERYNRDPLALPFYPTTTRQRSGEEAQAVDFKPAFTSTRWEEEGRILFSNKAQEKATRIINTLQSLLLPPAMEAKRLKDIEEAERKAAAEAKAKEEQERAEAEKAEAEKKQREEEEARAAEEAARALAELNSEDQTEVDTDMAGTAPVTTQAPEVAVQEPAAPRITATIRGRTVDITNLGIDHEYLQALPEEFREEVIMSQFAEQRSQAHQAGETPNEISREFLEALPPEIQAELMRQETIDRRRRERDLARQRQAAEQPAQPPAQAQDMEAMDFLATLDPITRQQILMDVRDDPNYMSELPEDIQREARALMGDRRNGGHRLMAGDHPRIINIGREQPREVPTERNRSRPIVQMLDKAGVATLLRLMFVSLHYKPKTSLHNILSQVCKNTQNRAEVISILLSILQDGTADVSAVERSFAQLTLRAKQNGPPKTPQPLKRTLTGQIIQPVTELSPLTIVQHCLGTLTALATDNPKVQTFFLSEHETVTSQKGKSTKKSKTKESKAAKYPLNALLTLLDRKLITENTGVMETLASLLSRVTLPLQILLKRAKEAQDAQEKAGETAENAQEPTDAMETSTADVRMQEITGEATTNDTTDEQAEQSEKKKRSTRELEPPDVPEDNIRLVVNILAARECPSKTFSDTLDIIKHMAAIPGAREVFGRELIRQAQELGSSVVTDLNELAEHIGSATSGTDIQGMALASFSSSGSKQRKLLRILVALDHLFDPKRIQALPKSALAADATLKEEILATLYESGTFQGLWKTLSLCLTAIRQRGDMVNVATILLPLIESLMVVCRNSALKDAPLNASQAEVRASTPPPETRMEDLFFKFTEEHRKILNELIRNNPKLMNGNLSILAKNSKVLEFDNKRNYFNRKVHNKGAEGRVAHPALTLNVRRDQVFLDSYKMLYYKSGDEIKTGKLNIRFTGEEGVDAGGVSREWFAVMARQMFNPDFALFNPVASDRTTFHPNSLSDINPEHLSFFKFIGRVIGKALYEGRVLDCHFSRAVYRRILGKSVSLKDMETLDLDYYKSLVWILENDITDITFETFSVEVDKFGVVEVVDLIENGRNIAVTEENKQEYVRLVVEHRLVKSVEEQLDNFLKGFHDIIPSELISIFNEQELELLISGLPDIDVDDWKNNTEYHNYQATSAQIQWFWRAVKSFDPEERAKLLQFVTGTSKVPLNGFKELEGMNGFAKFNIHRDYSSKEKLPTSHTCFNQLDLPEYESYEHLRQQLYTAITAGSEYFGFA